MEIHTLPSITKRSKKRLGQGHGSGRVKTGGRGTKGQNSRNKVPIYFEGGAVPLTKRMPFLRGKDRNKSLQVKPVVLNLDILADLPEKTVVDIDALIKHHLVDQDARATGVKLLGKGEVDKVYTINIPTSKSAAEKIIKAGGSIENRN